MRPILLTTICLLCLGSSELVAATATIDVKNERQLIEGFGTCLVSWGKNKYRYDDEMADIYANKLGFNILRCNMAAWGVPQINTVEEITADKIIFGQGDKQNERNKIFLDFAKKLLRHNPETKVIGTVWSPPPWMKYNNHVTNRGQKSIQGNSYSAKGPETTGRVKTELYPHFCRWIIAQMQQFKNEGVPMYAISPGNEIMFSQRFESCVWTAPDFAKVVGMLGEMKAQHGFKNVKIFGPETMTKHNWSIANPLYIKELQKDKTAWKHFDIFATHGYVDGFKEDMKAESSLAYWNLIKDLGRQYWVTEGGTGEHDWPKPLNGVAIGVHNSLVAGNANAFVPWQFTGEKPNEHCLMVEKRFTKKTHAMRHFSLFIKAGAKRIDVPEQTGQMRVSSFYHKKNKTLTVVVINADSSEQSLDLNLKGLNAAAFTMHRTSASEDLAEIGSVAIKKSKASVTLPAQSMITLVAESVR